MANAGRLLNIGEGRGRRNVLKFWPKKVEVGAGIMVQEGLDRSLSRDEDPRTKMNRGPPKQLSDQQQSVEQSLFP